MLILNLWFLRKHVLRKSSLNDAEVYFLAVIQMAGVLQKGFFAKAIPTYHTDQIANFFLTGFLLIRTKLSFQHFNRVIDSISFAFAFLALFRFF